MPSEDFRAEDSDRESIFSEKSSSVGQLMHLQNFPVQLLNVAPVEIVAKRFPSSDLDNVNTNVDVQITISGLHIFTESLQAQVVIDVRIESVRNPPPYEMFFRVVGIFAYEAGYAQEKVHQFLQQGCISVMLPFMRELVFSTSSRLQIPPIMLSLIQLIPPTTADNNINDPLH